MKDRRRFSTFWPIFSTRSSMLAFLTHQGVECILQFKLSACTRTNSTWSSRVQSTWLCWCTTVSSHSDVSCHCGPNSFSLAIWLSSKPCSRWHLSNQNAWKLTQPSYRNYLKTLMDDFRISGLLNLSLHSLQHRFQWILIAFQKICRLNYFSHISCYMSLKRHNPGTNARKETRMSAKTIAGRPHGMHGVHTARTDMVGTGSQSIENFLSMFTKQEWSLNLITYSDF